MKKIISGNLNKQDNLDQGGWFIGHFIKDKPFFKNNEFEVRWRVHKKGEKKSQVAANKVAKTISILINGKMLLKFPKDNKEIVLSKIGDYVWWDSEIFHASEMLEDTTTLTIRWPSVANDQIPIS